MTRSTSPPGKDRRGRSSHPAALLGATALVAAVVTGFGLAADPIPPTVGTPNSFPLLTVGAQTPTTGVPGVVPTGTTPPTAIGQTQPGTPPAASPATQPVTPGTPPQPGPYAGPLSNPLLSPTPKHLGPPQASAATQEKVAKYVARLMDPETTLDLIAGQTRVLVLKGASFRVQVGDENVVAFNIINPKEILLQGKAVGATVVNIWFGDPKDPPKQETLTYLVRVFPDPEAKERLEKAYKALEDDINKFFKDTSVRLKLVGDKVVISGRVRDFVQGGQILQIVRANMSGAGGTAGGPAANIPLTPAGGVPAPGSNTPTYESYLAAGGPNVINLLEVAGEQQVMLRVIVAEVNRAAARSLGMNFSVQNNQGLTVFSNNTGGIRPAIGGNGGVGGFGFGGGQFGGTIGNIFTSFNAGRIPFALNALKTVQYARSLAEPTLVTLNGQPANFHAGGSFPVPVVAAGGNAFGGLQGVQYVPYGVQLNFTPFITDRDKLRLVLNATVSSRDLNSSANIGGANVSGLNTRNVNTTVELRQGETLAVAGLIESNLGADASKIPFIGDLGMLGPLTGLHRAQAGEKELVIFITPELVRPIDPNQLIKLPGHEILDPNDLEFYLMGRLEGHCKDYRSPIRTDLSRIKMYFQVESANVAGPTGYTPVGP